MKNNFRSPHLFWWIIIPGGVGLIFLLGHYPNVIPFQYLGGFGASSSSFALKNHILLLVVFWSTVIAHGYEAIVARRICQKLNLDQKSTLLWMIQTFILGFPSLKNLKGQKHRYE
ncbi:unnamed protein product [Adineta steineri]|uniref:Transmembrane protein 254 n=1 Tax=Adineta steineri TaxID=433720 RepID=A0A815N5F7_9BILA|nr:unnamed protein product [Adineta steineri]CAF1430327.1 unnamed protein product [Adineta steineri]CAF3946065.1 unnamed protein product [Adineta steineri]CAF3997549.1 unnamed protein product [Adineta steineri]